MFKHREGILAWYDMRITTAMVEGINNKIKVMKREAYGFTDARISSFVCWLCTTLTSRHSCEDPYKHCKCRYVSLWIPLGCSGIENSEMRNSI